MVNTRHIEETCAAERVKALTRAKLNINMDASPRRIRSRWIVSIAIAATLVLTIGGAAIAASMGAIKLSGIFGSVFNGEKSQKFVKTGDEIEVISSEGDVSVEMLAGFIDGEYGAYVQLRVHELSGTKLTDSLSIPEDEKVVGTYEAEKELTAQDTFIFLNGGNRLNTGGVDVSVIDSNTVETTMFTQNKTDSDGKYLIKFDTIASGIRTYLDPQDTGLSIGEIIRIADGTLVSGAEFITIRSIDLDGNKLSIAHYNSDAAIYGWGSASLGLLKPDGEVIWATAGSNAVGVPGQTDIYELGDANPGDLTLVWQGCRADYVLTGDWEFAISSENILMPKTLSGEVEGHFASAVIGATSVEIEIHADYYHNEPSFDPMADGALEIILNNGQRINSNIDFHSSMLDETIATFSYSMSFVNPDDITSIVFCGNEIS